MKIAVLGAGAMGSLIGAFLKKSGEDVLLVDPYEEHMKKIRMEGLTLHLNGNVETICMDTVTSPDGQQAVDLLIVLVKGIYTDSALAGAKDMIGSHTYLLTLQNGLGNSEVLKKYAKETHILKGVMKIASRMEAPGEIASKTMAGVPALFLGCEKIPKKQSVWQKNWRRIFSRLIYLHVIKRILIFTFGPRRLTILQSTVLAALQE